MPLLVVGAFIIPGQNAHNVCPSHTHTDTLGGSPNISTQSLSFPRRRGETNTLSLYVLRKLHYAPLSWAPSPQRQWALRAFSRQQDWYSSELISHGWELVSKKSPLALSPGRMSLEIRVPHYDWLTLPWEPRPGRHLLLNLL